MKQSMGTVKARRFLALADIDGKLFGADDLATVKQAQALLKVSRQSVYRIAAGQAWRSCVVGNARFWVKADVLATPPALERMSSGGQRGAAIKAKLHKGR